MFIDERFISKLIKIHGPHPVSTDGGTWYPQACRFLKLPHYTHSFYHKSIIERMIKYIKEGSNASMTIFHIEKRNCKLEHIQQWMNIFANFCNK